MKLIDSVGQRVQEAQLRRHHQALVAGAFAGCECAHPVGPAHLELLDRIEVLERELGAERGVQQQPVGDQVLQPREVDAGIAVAARVVAAIAALIYFFGLDPWPVAVLVPPGVNRAETLRAQ